MARGRRAGAGSSTVRARKGLRLSASIWPTASGGASARPAAAARPASQRSSYHAATSSGTAGPRISCCRAAASSGLEEVVAAQRRPTPGGTGRGTRPSRTGSRSNADDRAPVAATGGPASTASNSSHGVREARLHAALQDDDLHLHVDGAGELGLFGLEPPEGGQFGRVRALRPRAVTAGSSEQCSTGPEGGMARGKGQGARGKRGKGQGKTRPAVRTNAPGERPPRRVVSRRVEAPARSSSARRP